MRTPPDTEHAKRKTVTSLDVVYALKRAGKTLYGFVSLPGLAGLDWDWPLTVTRSPGRLNWSTSGRSESESGGETAVIRFIHTLLLNITCAPRLSPNLYRCAAVIVRETFC